MSSADSSSIEYKAKSLTNLGVMDYESGWVWSIVSRVAGILTVWVEQAIFSAPRSVLAKL